MMRFRFGVATQDEDVVGMALTSAELRQLKDNSCVVIKAADSGWEVDVVLLCADDEADLKAELERGGMECVPMITEITEFGTKQ